MFSKARPVQPRNYPGNFGITEENMPRTPTFIADLSAAREKSADTAFEADKNLKGLADFDRGWTVDGDIWSRQIYWPGDPDSIPGSFGVEFKPDTAVIVEKWSQ